MSAQRRGTVWCPRGKHRLAWLEVDAEGRPVVCVAAVAPGRDRLAYGVSRVPVAQLEGFAGQTMDVGCACKKRFTIDLVPVWRDEPQTPVRITGDDFPGVSHDR